MAAKPIITPAPRVGREERIGERVSWAGGLQVLAYACISVHACMRITWFGSCTHVRLPWADNPQATIHDACQPHPCTCSHAYACKAAHFVKNWWCVGGTACTVQPVSVGITCAPCACDMLFLPHGMKL